jgi:uncharacterized protein
MRVRQVDDPHSFLEAAGALLLADEARHNLILGLAAALRDTPSLYKEHRLWLVEDDDAVVVGAALRTAPYNLVLAQPRDDMALAALVDAVEEDLPGIVGALPEAEIFATAWQHRTGRGRRVRRQGIYALEHVRSVTGVSGSARPASDDDLALLRQWLRSFAIEALGGAEPDLHAIERTLQHRLRGGDAGFVLWDDGGPVSIAAFGNPTPTGMRIGPVYTAPEHRRRGYASALVAYVCALCLAAGRRFCFLYTDLANPTSNRIYTEIGYEWVCESAEIAFV